jgi:YidC/Oxa1 family membrane protein insertase
MMSIMPWMMMFMMAPFASGLLIYWITSNLLTVAQQKYLYSRHPGMKAMVEQERATVARAIKDRNERAAARTGARVDEELVERARRLFSGRVDFLLPPRR